MNRFKIVNENTKQCECGCLMFIGMYMCPECNNIDDSITGNYTAEDFSSIVEDEEEE